MPISQDRRDLFRSPTTADNLNLLKSLSDSNDLTSDQALALINIIRAELEQPEKQSASTYRRYSEVMRALHEQLPDVHAQVVDAWQQRRRNKKESEKKEEKQEDVEEKEEAESEESEESTETEETLEVEE